METPNATELLKLANNLITSIVITPDQVEEWRNRYRTYIEKAVDLTYARIGAKLATIIAIKYGIIRMDEAEMDAMREAIEYAGKGYDEDKRSPEYHIWEIKATYWFMRERAAQKGQYSDTKRIEDDMFRRIQTIKARYTTS